MKNINVATLLGPVAVTEDHGRELFVSLLEVYVEGDREEEIDINFHSTLNLGPEFFKGFVHAAKESSVLGIEKIKSQVTFSGLFVTDMMSLTDSLRGNQKEKSEMESPEIQKKLSEALDKLRSESAKNPFMKKTDAGRAVGAALSSFLQKVENTIKDTK